MALLPNPDKRHQETFVIQERVAGKRLDQYLGARFEEYSRSYLAKLIEQGDIQVDGRSVRPSHRVRAGQTIQVSLPVLEKTHLQPDPGPLSILYQDEFLVAINKPSGMVVHPSRGHQRGTLVNRLLAHFESLSSVRSELRPGIVHRLDRDTSGVILVACQNEAHIALARQFEERQVAKEYLAIIHGLPKEDTFSVDDPIGPHPKNRLKMAIRHDVGQTAETHFQVLERFRAFSLVQAKPITGRTHQIRIHLARVGHPIAADPLYSGRDRIGPSDLTAPPQTKARDIETPLIHRTSLHAARIAFTHPIHQKPMHIEASIPPDLEAFLEQLRDET